MVHATSFPKQKRHCEEQVGKAVEFGIVNCKLNQEEGKHV